VSGADKLAAPKSTDDTIEHNSLKQHEVRMSENSFKESYNEVIETDGKVLLSRRNTRYRDFQNLIKKFGMDGYCDVHPEFLWRSVQDYFRDVEQLKRRHGHTYTQIEKIYAYELYWHLTNNVIQVTDAEKQMKDPQTAKTPDRLFANEYILAYWVMKSLCTELKRNVMANIHSGDIGGQFERKFESHKSVREFHTKLYYTFRYRTYTQETLLLALEGFKAGVEFMYGKPFKPSKPSKSSKPLERK
jgi:hypothetical protein